MPIRVFVVDDSAIVRQVIADILNKQPDIRVIGAAPDPLFAMDKMQKDWPDVITLDVEMPRMDGITFLKKIMSTRPTPIIMCSSLTTQGCDLAMDALGAGAVAVITKPTMGVKDFLQDTSDDLVSVVRAAAKARLRPMRSGAGVAASSTPTKLTADAMLTPPSGKKIFGTTEKIVAIGISTGGVQALEVILPMLPRTCPGTVIVQHMPEKFTASLANRLNLLCDVEVKEAQHGDRIIPGRVLIAPGGRHTLVKRNGAQYQVEVIDGPPVSRHRPSVDVLFRSVAKSAGMNATGIIMTGMGDDGARGLLEMAQAGARTMAQNEESCVVFGMPKEAIRLGATKLVVALEAIPSHIVAG